MNVIIEISEDELNAMGIRSEQLARTISDKIDSITVKKQKIIHQTELDVQVKIVKKK